MKNITLSDWEYEQEKRNKRKQDKRKRDERKNRNNRFISEE